MSWWTDLRERLRCLARSPEFEVDLQDELRFHLEQSKRSYRERGFDHDEAERRALLDMGGLEKVKEEVRDSTGTRLLLDLAGDLKLAWRGLVRSPTFALVAILTLGLGIGANSAIFSIVNQVLLRPLPYGEPEQLVWVWNRFNSVEDEKILLAPTDYYDLGQQADLFEGLAAANETVIAPLRTGDLARHVNYSRVTTNFFDVLQVRPRLGRTFLPEEGIPLPAGLTTPPPGPVILSHRLWQSVFAGRSDVVGEVFEMYGTPRTVVGVLPAGFRFLMASGSNLGDNIDVFVAMRRNWADEAGRESHGLRVVGRIRRGISIEQAQAQVESVGARLRERFEHHRSLREDFLLSPLHPAVVESVRPRLMVLSGIVFFVLLVACVNVANLLLIRSMTRRREFAVCAALGASRGRIARRLFTETLLLALLGIAPAMAVALLSIRYLQTSSFVELPRLQDIQLDPTVLGFTILACLFAAVLATLVPALESQRVQVLEALRDRVSGQSRWQSRCQNFLVVAEVALAVVLLVGTGLLVQTFVELQRVELGFDPEGLTTFSMTTPFSLPDREGFFEDIEDGLLEIPGVEAAGGVFPLPLNGIYDRLLNCSRSADFEDLRERQSAYFRIITPRFFDAFRIPLLAGRNFLRSDNNRETPRVILGQKMAEKLWPETSPVGESLTFQIFNLPPITAEVIGVALDVKQTGLLDETPTVYMPRAFYPAIEMSFAVRSRDADALPGRIRSLVARLNPAVPVDFDSMEEAVNRVLAPTRFIVTLVGVFSLLALLLAFVGLYGVIGYNVRSRRSELGIRMALGATRFRVVTIVLKRALTLTLIGMSVGYLGAFGGTSLMQSLLYEASSRGQLFLATALVLLLATTLAALGPALRATRIDPTSALKYE